MMKSSLSEWDRPNLAGVGVSRFHQTFPQHRQFGPLFHGPNSVLCMERTPQPEFVVATGVENQLAATQSRLSCGSFPHFAQASRQARVFTPTSVLPAHSLTQAPHHGPVFKSMHAEMPSKSCQTTGHFRVKKQPTLPPLPHSDPTPDHVSPMSQAYPVTPLHSKKNSFLRQDVTINDATTTSQYSPASQVSLSSNGTNSENTSMPMTPGYPGSFDDKRKSTFSTTSQDSLIRTSKVFESRDLELKRIYRQSGLDALDMAFWTGDGFYSDDDDDVNSGEYTDRLATISRPTIHMPHLSDQNMDVGRNMKNVFAPMLDRPLPPPTTEASNKHDEHIEEAFIDEYLHLFDSEPEESCDVASLAATSERSHYEDDEMLRASKRKSHLLSIYSRKSGSYEKRRLSPLHQTPNEDRLCSRCDQVVLGPAMRSSNGAFSGLYHPDCIRCASCHQKLPDSDIFVYKDEVYCRQHYHLQSGSICKGCGQGITGVYRKTSGNAVFHPSCLVCAFSSHLGRCGVLLDDYYLIDHRMYCEGHARSIIKDHGVRRLF